MSSFDNAMSMMACTPSEHMSNSLETLLKERSQMVCNSDYCTPYKDGLSPAEMFKIIAKRLYDVYGESYFEEIGIDTLDRRIHNFIYVICERETGYSEEELDTYLSDEEELGYIKQFCLYNRYIPDHIYQTKSMVPFKKYFKKEGMTLQDIIEYDKRIFLMEDSDFNCLFTIAGAKVLYDTAFSLELTSQCLMVFIRAFEIATASCKGLLLRLMRILAESSSRDSMCDYDYRPVARNKDFLDLTIGYADAGWDVSLIFEALDQYNMEYVYQVLKKGYPLHILEICVGCEVLNQTPNYNTTALLPSWLELTKIDTAHADFFLRMVKREMPKDIFHVIEIGKQIVNAEDLYNVEAPEWSAEHWKKEVIRLISKSKNKIYQFMNLSYYEAEELIADTIRKIESVDENVYNVQLSHQVRFSKELLPIFNYFVEH